MASEGPVIERANVTALLGRLERWLSLESCTVHDRTCFLNQWPLSIVTIGWTLLSRFGTRVRCGVQVNRHHVPIPWLV